MLHGNTHTILYTVEAEDAGRKIIDLLARNMGMSSRLIRKCKQDKTVELNGTPQSVNQLVQAGDMIRVELPHDPNIFEPEPIPIEVVYEDADILVVNKAPGIVVHPTKGHPFGTLGNAVAWYAAQKGDSYKIRFVNRLDRDTTGLLIIAKNGYAQQFISDRMQEDQVEKRYLALVHGCPAEQAGVVDAPIDRLQPEDILRQVHEDGKPSVTHYRVMADLGTASLLELILETGRTHQIRVHMAHLGHPLYGDQLYGREEFDGFERQALHAWRLKFETPRSGWLELKAPLPADMTSLLRQLGWEETEAFR